MLFETRIIISSWLVVIIDYYDVDGYDNEVNGDNGDDDNDNNCDDDDDDDENHGNDVDFHISI